MTDWPADKVERRAVSALVPFARNSRIHSVEQIEQVARSIVSGAEHPISDELSQLLLGTFLNKSYPGFEPTHTPPIS